MSLAADLSNVPRLLCCLPMLALLASAQTSYTFVTFTVPNSSSTGPYAINERGDVTGFYQAPPTGAQIGFLRLSSGEITTVLYPGASGSLANGINNFRVIAGTYWYQIGGPLAGFFYRNGAYQDAVVNGHPASVVDMNDRGYYVGYYGTPQSFTAFVAAPSGQVTILQYPGGYRTGPAWIKNNGAVIGSYQDRSRRLHTFVYNATSGYRTIAIPGKPGATITDVNSSGVIVGGYFNGATVRAFTYQKGQFRILWGLGSNSSATSINNKGQIAGGYTTSTGANVGFIATPVPQEDY